MTGNAVIAGLLRPLSADAPCGEDLEGSPVLAAFDVYRLFGQQSYLGSRRPGQKEDDPPTPPNWIEITDKCLAALAASKDLRVLVHLAAAQLWADGVVPFCQTLHVAAVWLQTWFGAVYPRPDEDILFRTNALNNLVDRVAIVDPLRRSALLSNRQFGVISLRNIDLSTGAVTPTAADTAPPKEGEVTAAFAAAPIEELRTLASSAKTALEALALIDRAMTAAGGVEATPNFDGRSDAERQVSLRHQLRRIHEFVTQQLAARPEAAAPTDGPVMDAGGGGTPVSVGGPIRTRDDAIRSLNAVISYFQRFEPSSPVPLFVERAKRLIAKDFLEIVQEVVPEALNAAKAAGGIRDEK